MRKKKIKLNKPRKSADIPATKGMLDNTRKALKSDITSVHLELKSFRSEIDARFYKQDSKFKKIDAHFDKVDARFKEVDARFDNMDARFKEVDARFDNMDAKFEKLISAVHEVKVITQEQAAQNKFILDSYALMYESHKEFNQRLKKLEA